MPYELRKSIEHANDLQDDVRKVPVLVKGTPEAGQDETRYSISYCEYAPRSSDELRAIYAKEKYSLTAEELETIINLVKTHL